MLRTWEAILCPEVVAAVSLAEEVCSLAGSGFQVEVKHVFGLHLHSLIKSWTLTQEHHRKGFLVPVVLPLELPAVEATSS